MNAEYHIYHRQRRQPYKFTGVAVPFEDLPSHAHVTDVQYCPETDTWSPQLHQCGQYVRQPSNPVSATFDEYLQNFEAWELDLLIHTRMSTDPFSVCDTLAHGIRAASDGSVCFNTQGSFGWVLSAKDGERMATGMGPARGPRPTSFLAEGYALLSLILFLHRVKDFASMHDPWIGIMGTDSKSLLHVLLGKEKNPEPHHTDNQFRIAGEDVVLDVLRPDWDVLIEIQHAMKRLPEVQLQFTRGHQDRHTRFARLPLISQLNVEADDMAAIYQNEYGCDRPIVLMSPRTRAHLVSKEGTITANYPGALRVAYSGPQLQRYIQQRNKWSDATMAIFWTSHGTALQNHFPLRLHFSKLVHDILPTTAHVNKMDKGKRQCPTCSHTLENRDHIIRCPHPTRNKWRHALLTALHESCLTLFTYNPLRELLEDSTRVWMYDDAPVGQAFIVNEFRYPIEMRLLIRQQNNIGWCQLFHGRFSTEWSRLQGDYYYRTRDDRPGQNYKFTGDGWQVSIITFLWKQWRVLWKQRNQDVHGRARGEMRSQKATGADIYSQISYGTKRPIPLIPGYSSTSSTTVMGCQELADNQYTTISG
jgi:hypothetical protein